MSLSPARRATLARLAALMAPGDRTMPSASAIELAAAPAEHVLRISAHLRDPLFAFLDAAESVADLSGLEAVAQADREGFAALSVTVANAYFMHPDVRRAIGYPGQEARDSGVGLSETDRALLETVRGRGTIYRDVP